MDILAIINTIMGLLRKVLDQYGEDIMKELLGFIS